MSTDLPAGWSIRRPSPDHDVPAILALVHASDIAAVGEPDFTTDEILEILNAPNHDPDRDSWLAVDSAGRVVGWAYLDNPISDVRENLDVYVWPEDGIPAQAHLLALAVARIAERAAEAGRTTVTARAGAIASEHHYLAVLAAAGFAFIKRYGRMRRALTGAETRPVPGDGVLVRNLRAGDQADLRAFFDLLKAAFDDIPDSLGGGFDDYAARLAALPSVSWDEWFVAEVDGVPAAVLQSADQVDEQNEAWVKNLAVARAHRGRGLGRLLLGTAFATYAAKGRQAVGLGVDMTNPTGAYRLYESVGMSAVYEADVYEREVSAAVP